MYEGRRSLGILRGRWEDDSKVDIEEVVMGGMDWIDMARDWGWWGHVVNAVMYLLVL
jgi:hypothetical protein